MVARRGQRGGVVRQMERAAVDGLELEYEVRGSGEPVVLIHRGVCATWAEPLLDEPALASRFEQAVTDADTFFRQELPALQQ